MKKVLIISYFFPPANFVGAERTAAWAKHLHEFGYYPIIITRNWNENQTDLTERVINNDYSIEKTDQYEIRRLPYKHSLRDKLAEAKRFRLLQKGLTLKELILSNFLVSALPFSNFYDEAKSVLKKENDIVAVIASITPFQSIKIGHLLKKEHPKLLWIPDYRDEWATDNRKEYDSRLKKIVSKLEEKSELKWIKNADFFTTVSKTLVNKISKFTKLKGEVVLNGFELNQQKTLINQSKNELNLMYIGTIYQDQNFEPIIKSISTFPKDFKITLHFIGSGKPTIILTILNKYPIDIKFTPRLNKNELYDYIEKCDAFILTSYPATPGIYPVKLFEYYKFTPPIILCPSDNSVMEEFIQKSNSGFIANTTEECSVILENLIKKKKRGDQLFLERNTNYGLQFSRKHQTKKLAEILNKHAV